MPKKFLPPAHDYTRSKLLNYLIRPFASLFRLIGVYKPEVAKNPTFTRMIASLSSALDNITSLPSPTESLKSQLEQLSGAYRDNPHLRQAYQQGSGHLMSLSSEMEELTTAFNQAKEEASVTTLELDTCRNNRKAAFAQKRLSTELAVLISQGQRLQALTDEVNQELEQLNSLLPDDYKLSGEQPENDIDLISGPLVTLESLLGIMTNSPARSSTRQRPATDKPSELPPHQIAQQSQKSMPKSEPADINYVTDILPLTPDNLDQTDETAPLSALSNRSTTDPVYQNLEELKYSIQYTSRAIRQVRDKFNDYTEKGGKADKKAQAAFQQQVDHFLQLASQLEDEVKERKVSTNDLMRSYSGHNPADPVTHPMHRFRLRNQAIEDIHQCKVIAATYLQHYEAIHETIEQLILSLPVQAEDEMRTPFDDKRYMIAEEGMNSAENEELLKFSPSDWPILHKLQHNEASARKTFNPGLFSSPIGGG
ncbi:hypothetical protein EOPP23_12110 [Endozoicomonas sp. OPT23]|nr:hypothetical protein [Endozoicomonas sp. OPT23]